MKRVRVKVPPDPYDVLIGEGTVSPTNLRRALGKVSRGALVSSGPVMRRHGAALRAVLGAAGFEIGTEVLLEDGEKAKSVAQWERALGLMARAGLDRSSFVIAVGGGSVGDAAGFASASYMRGIRLLQIPTTLLSMVDSSVGGKTGLNLAEGKNLVGAFHQPSLVLIDTSFLRTLSAREFQSGVYEILKCGFLESPRLVNTVRTTRGLRSASDRVLEDAIAESVRIKARIVERDERESGDRALLNLGHTLGHALEAATSYRILTHGEAVGYGLEFAVDMSEGLGLCGRESADELRAAIIAVGQRTPLDAAWARAASRATMSDKKRSGARLREVLVARSGKPVVRDLDAKAFATDAFRWLASKTQRHP